MRTCAVADPRVAELCREFDIKIVGAHLYPQPGETRAVGTIRRIIDRHGVEHARLVLCILAEGRGNQALIDETSLWAISDLLRACPDLVEGKTTALLEMFDELPLGPIMAMVNELRGVVHQRHALAGMIYLYARRLRSAPMGAFKQPGQGKMRKASISEDEKRAGRQAA